MAGVFQVMAFGVRSLDKREVDDSFMAKLAKIATAEMISSKVICIFIQENSYVAADYIDGLNFNA